MILPSLHLLKFAQCRIVFSNDRSEKHHDQASVWNHFAICMSFAYTVPSTLLVAPIYTLMSRWEDLGHPGILQVGWQTLPSFVQVPDTVSPVSHWHGRCRCGRNWRWGMRCSGGSEVCCRRLVLPYNWESNGLWGCMGLQGKFLQPPSGRWPWVVIPFMAPAWISSIFTDPVWPFRRSILQDHMASKQYS